MSVYTIFDNLDPDKLFSWHMDYIKKEHPEIVFMTKEHAQHIANFVQTYHKDVEGIICQCEAGISRSSAIAAAVQQYFGQNDTNYFAHQLYYPNRYVYRLMCEAFGIEPQAPKRAVVPNVGPIF